MDANEIRAVFKGAALWRALGLPDADKVAALDGGKKEVKICSPFRADANPSFGVSLNPDGTLLGKDFSTGDTFNDFGLIAAAKGIPESDKMALLQAYHELAGIEWETGKPQKGINKKPGARQPAAKPLEKPPIEQIAGRGEVKSKAGKSGTGGKPVLTEVYDYLSADGGTVLHQTLRYEPKTFRQRRPALPSEQGDAEGWVWSLSGVQLVPYRLPEVVTKSGEIVLIVEGEKDADAAATLLTGLGVCVTTLPMGCGKWREEYAEWFKGREVVVLADYDESAAGFKGALKLCEVLRDVAARVGLLELPVLWKGAPYGADVSDWIDQVADYDAAAAHLASAVRRARLPAGLVYEGVVSQGPRGGLVVDEDMLARRLVADEQLLFSAASFWCYDGEGVWQREPTTLRIEAVIRDALRAAGGGSEITKSKVSSILGLAKSVRHLPIEAMNRQPAGMVNVANGLLDTRTGELKPHRADYLMNTRIPHPWVPGADCPVWLEWLAERHPDEETRRCIQEIFGYCMAVDLNYHVFFFFYGDGGTGKSTCVSVLEALIGEENRVSIQLEELDNAFMRSQLAGKALYLCKELTSKSFAHIGLIKAIVSGDPIPVDVKYAQPYDFRPFGRMVMESNVIATTPDSSGGFSRRFVQIDWDKPIPRDKMDFTLVDKFKAEMPGIMSWAMEGLKRLRERGHFQLTHKSEESRDQLLRHRSQVASFIASNYVEEAAQAGSAMMPVNGLYWLYQQWCEEFDVVPFYREKKSFMREVMSKRPEWRDRKKRITNEAGLREWVLVGLRTEEKLPTDYYEYDIR